MIVFSTLYVCFLLSTLLHLTIVIGFRYLLNNALWRENDSSLLLNEVKKGESECEMKKLDIISLLKRVFVICSNEFALFIDNECIDIFILYCLKSVN